MTKNGKIDVNAIFEGYTTARVKIFDASNTVIFEKNLGEVFALHQRFNVAALPEGAYTMEVSTSAETYYYSFNK